MRPPAYKVLIRTSAMSRLTAGPVREAMLAFDDPPDAVGGRPSYKRSGHSPNGLDRGVVSISTLRGLAAGRAVESRAPAGTLVTYQSGKTFR